MHYLYCHLDVALKGLLGHLVPEHHYKSVYDLLNSYLMANCVRTVIIGVVDLEASKDKLLNWDIQSYSTVEYHSYSYIKLHNFFQISSTLYTALNNLSIALHLHLTKPMIANMIAKFDLNVLQVYIEHLMELIICNYQVLKSITEMDYDVQHYIKEFIMMFRTREENNDKKRRISKGESIIPRIDSLRTDEERGSEKKLSYHSIIYKIEYFYSIITNQYNYLQLLKVSHTQLQYDNEYLKTIVARHYQYRYSFTQKLHSYAYSYILFQYKDDYIQKLRAQSIYLYLRNKVLYADLQRLTSKANNDSQYWQNRYDQICTKLYVTQKQKQDSEYSTKKVIANLKYKNKSITDKYKYLYIELVELNFDRDIKEKYYKEAVSALYSVRLRSSIYMPNSFADTMLNNSSNLSNRQKLSEDLHNVQRASNSFEEEMEMYEKIENEGQRKINDVLVENAKLKEKLNNVENKSIKELREENNKLKKKMNILKRKHEETLVQKQYEFDLVMACFAERIAADNH